MLRLSQRLLVTAALTMAASGAAIADDIVIGFAQASSNSAHRNTVTKRNVQYAADNFKDTKLIVTNAEGKSA